MELPRLEDAVRLGDEIGRGGFGVVRRGVRIADGAAVAVKLAHERAEVEERARAQREARLLARLSHPHLTDFHGLFQTADERLALVYELVEGEELTERMEAGPVSARRAVQWAVELAEALEAMHAGGAVHRDVKPENVRIRPDGGAKLLDFGLSRRVERGDTVTGTGVILGTAEYAPPEVLAGRPATARSDIFSLAVLVYRLLTGARPFEGRGTGLEARLQGRVVPPRERLSDLPASLDPVFRRALAPRPEARTGSPATFVVDLARALGREEALPAAWTRAGRGRWVGAAALVVLALLGAFLGPGGGESRGNSSPTGPAPAATPEEAARAGPFPSGYPDALRRELTDAMGWRASRGGERLPDSVEGGVPLVDPDPALQRARFVLLRERRRFLDWWTEGGRPEALPPGLVEELREVDGRYRGEGLPPVLGPFLDALPPQGEGPPPSEAVRHLVRAGVLPALPGPEAPWSRAAVDAVAAVQRIEDALARELRSRPAGPYPGGLGLAYLQMGEGDPLGDVFDLLASAAKQRHGRVAVLPWARPLQEATERAVLLCGRALEEEPASAPFVALVASLARWRLRPGFYRSLAGLPVSVLLRGAPESPEEHLVAAALLGAQWRMRRVLEIPFEDLREQQTASLEAAADASDPRVRARALELQVEAAAKYGTAASLAAALRRSLAVAGDAPGGGRENVLYQAGWGAERLGTVSFLTPEELTLVLEEMVRRVELNPAGESPARILRFLRESTGR